jgi:hypothetical protein
MRGGRLRTVRGAARPWVVAAGLLAAAACSAAAQVPCSGNAGGLNERRYSVAPLQVSTGPAGVNAASYEAGGVVITQQVQVIIELNQQSHLVSLCLHADYLPAGTTRAIANGDLEWRRVSPDPMDSFATVSRNTPLAVITQQAIGNLAATYEFRVRLRWSDYVAGAYSSSVVWSAFRNTP